MAAHTADAKDLPHTLTDDPQVIRAMKAIQRAGFWATLGGGLILLWFLYTVTVTGAGWNQLVIYAPWAAYLFWSGNKLNRLDGDKSITAILVINTVIGGLISLQAIFSIIALAKVGTYREWRKLDKHDNAPKKKVAHPKRVAADVHVFDPKKGEIIEEMTLDGETYDKFVDARGELYAIRHYEAGEAKTALVKRDRYKSMRSLMTKGDGAW